MVDLNCNVWIRQKLYGPGSPPPADLHDQVPPEAWVDEPGEDGGALSDLLGESLQPDPSP